MADVMTAKRASDGPALAPSGDGWPGPPGLPSGGDRGSGTHIGARLLVETSKAPVDSPPVVTCSRDGGGHSPHPGESQIRDIDFLSLGRTGSRVVVPTGGRDDAAGRRSRSGHVGIRKKGAERDCGGELPGWPGCGIVPREFPGDRAVAQVAQAVGGEGVDDPVAGGGGGGFTGSGRRIPAHAAAGGSVLAGCGAAFRAGRCAGDVSARAGLVWTREAELPPARPVAGDPRADSQVIGGNELCGFRHIRADGALTGGGASRP